jgi:hypothetical protein
MVAAPVCLGIMEKGGFAGMLGLIYSRKNPLILSNHALDMPFESLMGGEKYIDSGKIDILILLSSCAPYWKSP